MAKESGSMTFRDAIDGLRERFLQHGQFTLHPGESIKEIVRRENVPNSRGVYVCFANGDVTHPLYVGRSGTLNANGTWKNQGLRQRLTMKQGKKTFRSEFFKKLLVDEGFSELTFLWFVTHDPTTQNINTIPALVELQLLQTHYEQYGTLPELNKSA